MAFDSSSPYLSIAVTKGSAEPLSWESTAPGKSSEELASAIEALLQKAAVSPQQLSALVLGSGPGSFTGLRIGFAYAKGLAFALGIPLLTYTTGAAWSHGREGVSICLGDARRNEYFVSVWSAGQSLVAPCILTESEVLALYATYSQSKLVTVLSLDVPQLGDLVTQQPRQVGLQLLRVFEGDKRSSKLTQSNAELSGLEPLYLRAVAAKTIAERLAGQ